MHAGLSQGHALCVRVDEALLVRLAAQRPPRLASCMHGPRSWVRGSALVRDGVSVEPPVPCSSVLISPPLLPWAVINFADFDVCTVLMLCSSVSEYIVAATASSATIAALRPNFIFAQNTVSLNTDGGVKYA